MASLSRNLGQDVLLLNQCSAFGSPVLSCASFEFQGILYATRSQYGESGANLSIEKFRGKLAEATKQATAVLAFIEEQLPVRKIESTGGFDFGAYHGRAQNIIVYRSFLNWLASAFMHSLAGNQTDKTRPLSLDWSVHLLRLMSGWLQHAKLAQRGQPVGVQAVLYDHWLADESERARFLDALTVKPTNLSLPEICRYGGGSSFAPGQFEDAPDVSRLNSRFEQVLEYTAFLSAIKMALQCADLATFLQENFPADFETARSFAESLPGQTELL